VIKLIHLSKKINSQKILDDISLEINKGEVVGLIGPVDISKTILLRCIAGIETYYDGRFISEPDCTIGMVCKEINLFNNMSIIKNLCYPQEKVLKITRNQAEGIAMQKLKSIDMMHVFDKYPSDLSQLQKQKIAIVRTLCMNPSVILFDNPTALLDPEEVQDLLEFIKSLVNNEISIIIATHETSFLKLIASRIIFIEDGKIKSDITKDEFFNS
jgi:ABC-type polar amino acid transport system ATPase subunit